MDLVNAACVHGLLNNSWPTRLVRVSGCFCGLGKVADNILVVKNRDPYFMVDFNPHITG